MIIKALGVSSLIQSTSNISVPKDIISNVKGRLFRIRIIWKNNTDKVRMEGLYRDFKKGGLRMMDIETMIKATISILDTNTHTGGPSQLEICSRLFFF